MRREKPEKGEDRGKKESKNKGRGSDLKGRGGLGRKGGKKRIRV